jgi:sugar O-acyltransferase (sialic acid O-acetyltransferase NeuD family)
MEDIYVLGSGGFAKEVLFLIEEINNSSKQLKYNFKGFVNIEDGECKVGNKTYLIYSESSLLELESEMNLVIGIGSPNLCKKIVSKFITKANIKFPNLIHPNLTAKMDSIVLGCGNIITSGCIFTVDIKIESFNVFNLNVTVGHDTKIGSYNVINPGVNVSGSVEIGDLNLLGTNATVLQNLTIEDNSILGAGAVLTKNLESCKTAVGIPAKTIN